MSTAYDTDISDRRAIEAAISRRSWLATSGAAVLAACAATPARAFERIPAARSPLSAPLDDLPRWMRIASVPGVSVAIIDRDRTTTQGFGVTRASGSDAVNADTVFEAASLSKPVFAYLVLQLAGENVIDLDKPLGEYLALPNAADSAARPITARHVLSHTTGWRNWRFARDQTLSLDDRIRLHGRKDLAGGRDLIISQGD